MIMNNESIKRELKTRPTYECRCDERLKTKSEDSTRLVYTGILVREGRVPAQAPTESEFFGEHLMLE